MDGAYGIEETKDLIAFAAKVVNSLAKHKADDGKIDGAEIASTLVGSTPAGIAAMVGAGEIGEEMKDLSEAEKSELLELSIPVLRTLVGMFITLDEA